jgi:hypothetical protein
MYEAHIQGLYILCQRDQAESRAALYRDYVHVEQQRNRDVLEQHAPVLWQKLLESPKREKHQAERESELDRVQDAYKSKRGFRDDWFNGKLPDLAREVGRHGEYVVVQRFLSSAAHTMPMDLIGRSPFGKPEGLLARGSQVCLRVLGAVADHFSVTTDDYVRLAVDSAAVSFIEL